MAVSVREESGVSRRAFCANVSNENAEPLVATASRIDHWILVEYRGAWNREPLGDSLLAPEVKAHLRAQLGALRRARLLFVRRPERRGYARRQLFYGCSRPGEERFFGLEFDRHDDLVGLDLAAALAGKDEIGAPVGHPLFVVCTHGKRDRCCAKYGQPLYDELRRSAESGWVWQSTHVGGDRFAGNVVVLPEGLYYGRVAPDDVSRLLAEQAAGRVWLERYRGRSAYPFAVQAAEQAVRADDGLVGFGDVAVLGSEVNGDGWHVRLRDVEGAVHEVDVVEEHGEDAVYLTCGSTAPQHARRFVTIRRSVTRP